jgi:hypothetical protein
LTLLVTQHATMRSTVEPGCGKSCAKILDISVFIRDSGNHRQQGRLEGETILEAGIHGATEDAETGSGRPAPISVGPSVHLLSEALVIRQLEALHPVRLEFMGLADALDAAGAHAFLWNEAES